MTRAELQQQAREASDEAADARASGVWLPLGRRAKGRFRAGGSLRERVRTRVGIHVGR